MSRQTREGAAMLATIAMMMALAAADPPAATDNAAAGNAPQAQTGRPAKPKPKHDPNAMVCQDVPEIGSTIPKRVCHTQAEWDGRARDDQQEMRRLQDAGGGI